MNSLPSVSGRRISLSPSTSLKNSPRASCIPRSSSPYWSTAMPPTSAPLSMPAVLISTSPIIMNWRLASPIPSAKIGVPACARNTLWAYLTSTLKKPTSTFTVPMSSPSRPAPISWSTCPSRVTIRIRRTALALISTATTS